MKVLKKNHSIGLTPDKNLGISWFLSSFQHGRIRGMAVFSGDIWQSKNTLQLEGKKKSEFQYLHMEIEAFGVLLDFYYKCYYIYYCICFYLSSVRKEITPICFWGLSN